MTYPPKQPSQPQPPAGPWHPGLPAPQAPKRNRGWIIALSILGVVVLLCGCGGLLAYVGSKMPAKPASAAQSPGSGALGAVSPSSSTAPSAVARTTAAAPPKLPPSRTAAAPGKPNYAAAAAILRADNEHYRQRLREGQAAFNTPRFASWYQAIIKDQQYQADAVRADAYFTAANEPNALSTWREDIVQLTSDLSSWANAALMAEPNPANSTMDQFAKAVNADLAAVDKDAANVAAGR